MKPLHSIPTGKRHHSLINIDLLVYDYQRMQIEIAKLAAHQSFRPWQPFDAWLEQRVPITFNENTTEFDWGIRTGKVLFLAWHDFQEFCNPAERPGILQPLQNLLTRAQNPPHSGSEETRLLPAKELFVQDPRGWTRLFYAARHGDKTQVEKMIFRMPGTGFAPQRLGFITQQDQDDLTAADIAEQHGHQEIADLLRNQVIQMEYYG